MSPTTMMTTSPEGVDYIERKEGVVTKTYICPAGKPTIGAGLTKASGVIDPKPGMVITKQRASELLAKSLEINYEPRVRNEMPGAEQFEFDAGVSFDFNTGAINRASWVGAWIRKDWPDVERRIKMWKKGGGRVLPGLVRRRQEEFNMMRLADYGHGYDHNPPQEFAKIVVRLDADEVIAMHAAFKKLGYEPGEEPGRIRKKTVWAFQGDHDLVVDGIIGIATLSTLQRRLDAKTKAVTPTAATAAGGGATATPDQIAATAPETLSPDTVALLANLTLAVGVLFLLWLAWRYRDVLAVKVQDVSPKLASFLRGY